jgi:hypothetical protein
MPAVQDTIERVRRIDVDQYKYGFVTDIESDKAPKGLNEDTVRFISAKKNEPEWMLAWRLDAYRRHGRDPAAGSGRRWAGSDAGAGGPARGRPADWRHHPHAPAGWRWRIRSAALALQ